MFEYYDSYYDINQKVTTMIKANHAMYRVSCLSHISQYVEI